MKLYFQFIMHQRQYVYIKDLDLNVENFLLLTKNRIKEDLIYISSNPLKLITALSMQINVLPVAPFESNTATNNEYQLCLLENYILKYRHDKEIRERLKSDFAFLLNNITSSKLSVHNNFNESENNEAQS